MDAPDRNVHTVPPLDDCFRHFSLLLHIAFFSFGLISRLIMELINSILIIMTAGIIIITKLKNKQVNKTTRKIQMKWLKNMKEVKR